MPVEKNLACSRVISRRAYLNCQSVYDVREKVRHFSILLATLGSPINSRICPVYGINEWTRLFKLVFNLKANFPNLLKALWRLWSFCYFLYHFSFFFSFSFPSPPCPALQPFIFTVRVKHITSNQHTRAASGSVGFPRATKAQKKI
jgi:hypothetical protein